jgi:hypothetical protein
MGSDQLLFHGCHAHLTHGWGQWPFRLPVDKFLRSLCAQLRNPVITRALLPLHAAPVAEFGTTSTAACGLVLVLQNDVKDNTWEPTSYDHSPRID